jgi:hypothetical protein
MLRPLNNRRRAERGSAMLESALVLGVFLVTLISLSDIALWVFVHQSLTERVRSSLRTAVVQNLDPTSVANLIAYNQTATPGIGTTGMFGMTAANVTVTLSGAGTQSQRMVASVTNVGLPLMSPVFPGSFHNLPIRIGVNLEAP